MVTIGFFSSHIDRPETARRWKNLLDKVRASLDCSICMLVETSASAEVLGEALDGDIQVFCINEEVNAIQNSASSGRDDIGKRYGEYNFGHL